MLQKAEELFAQKQYSAAEEYYNSALKNPFANAQDFDLAHCRLGIIKSYQGDNLKASAKLEASLKNDTLTGYQKNLCQYALLQVYVQIKNYSAAEQLLQKLESLTLGPVYMARIWGIGVHVARALKNQSSEALYMSKLDNVFKIHKINDIEIAILSNLKFTSTEVQDWLDHNKAINTSVKPTQQPQRDPIVNDNGTMRIGVLLPADKLFNRFNYRILKSIAAFQNLPEYKKCNCSFLIKTFSTTNNFTLENVTFELITQHKVHAIMGTVSAAQAVYVAPLAHDSKIPFFALGPIPLSNEFDSPFVIRMGAVAKSQAHFIAEYFKKQNPIDFTLGILAPDDAYGSESVTALEAALKKNNASLVYKNFFTAQNNNFKNITEQLLQQQDQNLRNEQKEKIIAEAKIEAEKNKRKFDPGLIKIPIALRFKTLFIPDGLNQARNLASTLAYYDIKNLNYIGDFSWKETLSTGQNSLADELLEGSQIPSLVEGKYAATVKNIINEKEVSEIGRQAFDTLVLLTQARLTAKTLYGQKMAEALHNPQTGANIEGIAQYNNVNPDGEPLSQFEMKTLKLGRIL